jgi:putative metallohydrolase (TIGR04338 family)
MTSTRDTYRSRLYKSERSALAGTRTITTFSGKVVEVEDFFRADPKLLRLSACQAYVDHLVKSAWFQRRWPTVKHITVKDGRGARSAFSTWYNSSISLPLWARNEAVILHEVAHQCTDSQSRCVAPHGREFAQTFIALIEHKLGKAEAAKLKAEFTKNRVPWRKARKPSSGTL